MPEIEGIPLVESESPPADRDTISLRIGPERYRHLSRLAGLSGLDTKNRLVGKLIDVLGEKISGPFDVRQIGIVPKAERHD